MKKDIHAFIEEVVEELSGKLGSGYMVCAQTLWKNNGVARQCVVIADDTHKASPCYCMENYYELYQTPGDIRIVANDIIKAYRQEYIPDFSVEWLKDRDKVLGNVVFRIVSTHRNRELLENVPHYDVPGLDVSMLCYIFVNTENEDYASILLWNRNMEMLETSEKELLENAWRNTPAAMGHVIYGMEEMISGCFGGMNGSVECPEKIESMCVITSRQKLYGAGCILYPEVLEETAQKLGSDFYILPSSVHETIAISADGFDKNHAEELKAMVKEINRIELPREDVLTDSVYYYSSSQHKLFVAV